MSGGTQHQHHLLATARRAAAAGSPGDAAPVALKAAGLPPESIVQISADHLHESPFNPRKTYDDAALDELATDIASQPGGARVLQPLLVRPRIPPLFADMDDAASATVGYEIVFGHRRYRAGCMAGLATLPCMVRAMSDAEAARAQISENLQRQDVHPIEEAEGFDALMREHHLTADDIAEQTGKSRSYVYGRLKLLQACPRIRTACLGGRIGSEVALLVARLRTDKLQEKALAYIDADYRAKLDDGGQASYRAVQELLREKFTLDIKSAIFPPEDATLVPAAGPCSSCPKRSGNAPEFTDLAAGSTRYGTKIGGPNVCTDPDCFADKKGAHLKREQKALEAKGITVVAGNAARAAVSAGGTVKGSYVAASALAKPAKGQKAPAVVTIQDPRTGTLHKAVRQADAVAAGLYNAPEPSSSSRTGTVESYLGQQARKAQWAAEETPRRIAAFEALAAALARTERSHADSALVAIQLFDAIENEGNWTQVTARHELIAKAMGVVPSALRDAIATMTGADHARLMLLVIASDEVNVNPWDGDAWPPALEALVTRYGVDCTHGAPTPPSAGASANFAAAAAGADTGPNALEVVDPDALACDNAERTALESDPHVVACGPDTSSTKPAVAGEDVPWPWPTGAR